MELVKTLRKKGFFNYTIPIIVIIAIIFIMQSTNMFQSDEEAFVQGLVNGEFEKSYTSTGPVYQEDYTLEAHTSYFQRLTQDYGLFEHVEKMDDLDVQVTYRIVTSKETLTLVLEKSKQPDHVKIANVRVYTEDGLLIPVFLHADEERIVDRVQEIMTLLSHGDYETLKTITDEPMSLDTPEYLKYFMTTNMTNFGGKAKAYSLVDIDATPEEDAYITLLANPGDDQAYIMEMILTREQDYALAVVRFLEAGQNVESSSETIRVAKYKAIDSEQLQRLANQVYQGLKSDKALEITLKCFDQGGDMDDLKAWIIQDQGIDITTIRHFRLKSEFYDELGEIIFEVDREGVKDYLTIGVRETVGGTIEVVSLDIVKATQSGGETLDEVDISNAVMQENTQAFINAWMDGNWKDAYTTLSSLNNYKDEEDFSAKMSYWANHIAEPMEVQFVSSSFESHLQAQNLTFAVQGDEKSGRGDYMMQIHVNPKDYGIHSVRWVQYDYFQ